ncbi:VIT1/CCC1 transporter family protein [Donghicola mangrovi]|nr:VIT1/CCC1 transporter family protein [Donghicola mangrovi]
MLTDPDSPETKGMTRTQDFLKQIVFGGNDGIVTTFAIVAGFAGARADGAAGIGAIAVLVFGLANLFADAVSMGLGEFLSLRSRHAMYRARRAKVLGHVIHDGPRAGTALSQFLVQRGVPMTRAQDIGIILSEHPEVLADLSMTFEHGMTDPDMESPWQSGLVTFVSFVLFGSLPLMPYFIAEADGTTLMWSVAATVGALAGLGTLRWRVTEDTALRAIGETVLVGAVCAAVAYGVGWAVGA